MEIKNIKNYLRLYNKYKFKYLKLKNQKQNQSGGSYNLEQLHLQLNNIIIEINYLFKKIKEMVPEYKT